MKNRFQHYVPFLITFFVPLALPAQSELRGRVTSKSGHPITAATVELTCTVDPKISRIPARYMTGTDGRFIVAVDVKHVKEATLHLGTWELLVQKEGYETKRMNVPLMANRVPDPVNVTLLATTGNPILMSRIDACANQVLDSQTLYFFSFMHDGPVNKMRRFHELLETRLTPGIREYLTSAGLLRDSALQFRWCHEAAVNGREDALFALRRLECPGIVWGYIEALTNVYKSSISFTAIPSDPLTEEDSVEFEADLAKLARAGQKVSEAYLAFSAFVLGNVYLQQQKTNLARQCFQHVEALKSNSTSGICLKTRDLLKRLNEGNPAIELSPVGGPGT